MSEGHEMSLEPESEDGELPLPDWDPEDMEFDYSSGSSTSSSITSSHSAQLPLNESNTTVPSLPLASDEQALVVLGLHSYHHGDQVEDLFASALDGYSSLSQALAPFNEESTLPQNESLIGTTAQAELPVTTQDSEAPHIDESTSVQSQEPITSNPDTIYLPGPNSMSDEQDLNAIVPASISIFNDQDALTAFHVYPPDGQNYNCEEFFGIWKKLWLIRKSEYPCINVPTRHPDGPPRPDRVSANATAQAPYDMQGINWSDLGTSQALARDVRRMTSRNFGNMREINPEKPIQAYATPAYKACFKSQRSPALSYTDTFFRFRESNLKQVPEYAHPQLRHCLCASSKNAVFFTLRPNPYAIAAANAYGLYGTTIKCLNPGADSSTRTVLDLANRNEPGAPRLMDIACMSASDGLLIVGNLNDGHYAMKSLSTGCEDTHTLGIVNNSGIGCGINHIHTFLHRRSGLPCAVFCDNDGYIRVTDCATTKWIYSLQWETPVNCSATSPDGRLRIHVSDDPWPIVSDAETGRVVARLPDHRDHGFACDWSPDGITMATGHQDGIVQIWDARKMNKAVHILPAEMGGIRSLHFSPLGAGHPVLVMAEPIDFVSIVDAKTFRSKQDIEFFGEISGVSMPPDGDTLFIGNADPKHGGIFEFERTGYSGQFKHSNLRCSSLRGRRSQRREAIYKTSPENSDCEDLVEEISPEIRLKRKWKLDDQDAKMWQTREHDWAMEPDIDEDRRAILIRKQRWRRHLGLKNMVF